MDMQEEAGGCMFCLPPDPILVCGTLYMLGFCVKFHWTGKMGEDTDASTGRKGATLDGVV